MARARRLPVLEIATCVLALSGPILCPILWIATPFVEARRFRSAEPELRAYALAVRTGRASPEAPPELPRFAPPIQHVELDGNGNVLFWTYSDVFIDEGFVLRADDKPLPYAKLRLGSQLDGDWWTFGN
jgi:hypothetical protein